MTASDPIDEFLSGYPELVLRRALQLREVVRAVLPGILEQLDVPARILGYSYGPKYADTVCVIIPSQKGLKLGFYKGPELPDPEGWLEGSGKLSRYVVIKTDDQINSPVLKQLLADALAAYRQRSGIL